jgi:carboxymethylenebutenolidase
MELRFRASDGHEFGAYRAEPSAAPRGGIVVLQEIFGVNDHIREVCDGFARDGYLAIAPALYDRSSRRDCRLGYAGDDVVIGRKLREEFSWDDTTRDVDAAAAQLRERGLKVATLGYCWGGSISFLCAARLNLEAAVVYYGGQILPYVDEPERCPLLMHFGERDAGIPRADVERIRVAHPKAQIHLYDADHGFNCDQRGSYDAAAAKLARERTLRFFAENLARARGAQIAGA